jgi:hypothetical protein
MCEDAYTAWQTDTEHGTPAILIAPDSHTVTILNTRAHNDRVTDGLVHPHGLTKADGTRIGVGDRVLTRCNDRRLRGRYGHVRNGDLWHVTALTADGGLVVSPLTRFTTGAAVAKGEAGGGEMTLPARYVAEHVDLGYATTTHRAQGITVDRSHVLAAPGMVRENLYVAMTRGRHDNHLYLALDEVDPTCDPPDRYPHTEARETLETILATSGAELSATETLAASHHAATSLNRLEPIRQTLLADAATHRWDTTFPTLGMTTRQCEEIRTSPARGALITALERGRTLGHPMLHVLAGLIAARPLDHSDDVVGDVASVLHHRVSGWLHTQVQDPTAIQPVLDLTAAPDDIADLVRQVDQLIADRTHAINAGALSDASDRLALAPAPPTRACASDRGTRSPHASPTTTSPAVPPPAPQR